MSDPLARLADICGRVADLNTKYSVRKDTDRQINGAIGAARIVAALDEFMECVRYLNTRRSDTTLALTSEAAVQDAVFLTRISVLKLQS